MSMVNKPVETKLQDAGSVKEMKYHSRRIAVVIAGMYRSGGGILEHIFSLLGCALPRHLPFKGTNGKVGHRKSRAISDFNDEVLEKAGNTWNDGLPLNPEFVHSAAWDTLIQRGRGIIREEFGNESLFILNDPRICRLAHFWSEILDAEQIDLVVVVPLRDPMAVAGSLARHNGCEGHDGLRLWLRHVLEAEATTRGKQRVFVRFDDLLANWSRVIGRIAKRSGIIWPHFSPRTVEKVAEFLRPELRYHSKASMGGISDSAISPWVAEAWEILRTWATGNAGDGDYARLDTIRQAFNTAPASTEGDSIQCDTEYNSPVDGQQAEQSRLQEQVAEETEERAAQDAVLIEDKEEMNTFEHIFPAHLPDTAGQIFRFDDERHTPEAEQIKQQSAHLLAECERARAEPHRDCGEPAVVGHWHEMATQLEAALIESTQALETLSLEMHEIRENEMTVRDRLDERSREIIILTDILYKHEELLEITTRNVQEKHEMLALTQHQLDECCMEIAALTGLLRQCEQSAQIYAQQVHWLRDIYRAISSCPWWWGYLPRRWQERKQERRMHHKGLFNARAYLSRYADVAQSCMSPLRHYILHGQGEGRVR